LGARGLQKPLFRIRQVAPLHVGEPEIVTRIGERWIGSRLLLNYQSLPRSSGRLSQADRDNTARSDVRRHPAGLPRTPGALPLAYAIRKNATPKGNRGAAKTSLGFSFQCGLKTQRRPHRSDHSLTHRSPCRCGLLAYPSPPILQVDLEAEPAQRRKTAINAQLAMGNPAHEGVTVALAPRSRIWFKYST